MSTGHPGQPDSEWISQAEAARLRGVSRQAVSKMIAAGRLQTFELGGRVFVRRSALFDLRHESEDRGGQSVRKIRTMLTAFHALNPEERMEFVSQILNDFPIHPFEAKIGASARVILEALNRSGELTVRMFRGVLAESAFDVNVVERLEGWRSNSISGLAPYDFLLDDGVGTVKVQVKLQRSERGVPAGFGKRARDGSINRYLVETQKTRKGTSKEGQKTRPYRFNEFDILAVAMYPTTRDWNRFFYTVGRWLLPSPENPDFLATRQPVAPSPDEDWTDDFATCVEWFRSSLKKTIAR